MKKLTKKDKIFLNLCMAFSDLIFFKAELNHKIVFNQVTRKKKQNLRKKKTSKTILESDFRKSLTLSKINILL